jgi:hypothetical protein
MGLEKPAKSRPSDPAFDLIESALHDSAVVLEAYGRFATTVIGTVLFPYAAVRLPESASEASAVRPPPQPGYPAIANVIVAFLLGVILGRRLLRRRCAPRRT